MAWQENFVREFNRAFGEPFLPKGFASAKLTEDGMVWIDIGDRDCEFDEKGRSVGSGSKVGEGRKWQEPEPLIIKSKENIDREYWECIIGPVDSSKVPPGGDFPIRAAVWNAFRELTGEEAEDCWSGWGVSEEVKDRILKAW